MQSESRTTGSEIQISSALELKEYKSGHGCPVWLRSLPVKYFPSSYSRRVSQEQTELLTAKALVSSFKISPHYAIIMLSGFRSGFRKFFFFLMLGHFS